MLASGILLATGLGATLFVAGVMERVPESDEIRTLGVMANATVIYDAFDRPVFTLFREQRLSVPLKNISHHLIDAVIAVEDRRFYRHRGFDLVRIAGAALADIAAGRVVQGGSTITQQLARVSLLSRERTFRRKAAEIITAVRIERAHSKDRILELYLNKVYFGAGFYGAEAAARGNFGKPAADLTLGEAALLAGLIQAPARHSPVDDPERALRRRDFVLAVMLETGVVDAEQVARAKEEPLRLENSLETPSDFGGYFKEEVRRRLLDRFGEERVFGEGLRVYTTLVPELQRAAEVAAAEGLARIEGLPRYPHRAATRNERQAPKVAGHELQAAIIALDPRTGAVRAVVGGRRFGDSPFNRATQARRQPGSAFKPFLFAAALDQGLTPVTRLDELNRPTPTAQGGWLPKDGHPEVSELSLRAALRLSSNRAAVRLLELTGIEQAADYAERFALGPQPPVPSIALGSGTVSLEALTAAYATFANRGVVPQPTYIRRVERASGTVLLDVEFYDPGSGTRAVGPATAFIVANLLRDVLDLGTGSRVRREGFTAPAGGKTGTTNDYKDAWFVGFTPELAAGVWIGFDHPRTIMPTGYAADLAAPMWARFMRAATGDEPTRWLAQPSDVVAVEVCAFSGALATDGCRRTHADDLAAARSAQPTYVEYFAEGTEPVERCPIHRSRPLVGMFAWLFGRTGGEGGRSSETKEELPPASPSRLPEALPHSKPVVVHDHIFGSCTGRLVASQDGLRYETMHKDAFAIPYADLEELELSAERRNLRIKPRGGRTYSFTDGTPSTAVLSAFHAEVQRAQAEHESR